MVINLMIECVSLVLYLQDGYWCLTEDVCSLVNVSAKSCEQILLKAGLKSLGEYELSKNVRNSTLCTLFI